MTEGVQNLLSGLPCRLRFLSMTIFQNLETISIHLIKIFKINHLYALMDVTETTMGTMRVFPFDSLRPFCILGAIFNENNKERLRWPLLLNKWRKI